ncbi:CrcB family protein [Microlunatus elymi]|uniref:Fluoride-specific ion channel FluC n=1 Tax=Microlunatus elymi TaxID=2596828 RepID=A0A516PY45_9ACTN|nr:CrcB family protein [Microlunatus elymi]QDP96090.1 CrcB family protein [Microlunatus elymi]
MTTQPSAAARSARAQAAKPPHQQVRYLIVVGIGGAVGTSARFLTTQLSAPWLSQPAATMIINVIGSLLLGLLLEALACRGPDVGRRRMVRLLLGTGVLGGFTTYSTFATDVQSYLQQGQWLLAAGYGIGSVLLGLLAAGVGVWLATVLHRGGRRPIKRGSAS